MRTVRVLVSSSCEPAATRAGHGLGCLEPAAGRFDESTADAIDALFDGAERSHVDVVLVAFARGGGGSARSPAAMFTSPAQRADAARRLRYVADRWGASPRLLAVELLDEPDARRRRSRGHVAAMGRGDEGRVAFLRPVPSPLRRAGRQAPDRRRPRLAPSPRQGPRTAARARARDDAGAVAEAHGLGKPVLCADFAESRRRDDARSRARRPLGARVRRSRRARATRRALRRAVGVPAHLPGGAALAGADVRVSRGKARAWSLVTPDALARGFWVLGAPEGDGRLVSGVELALPAPPAGRYVVTWIDDVTRRDGREQLSRLARIGRRARCWSRRSRGTSQGG